jgi:hypothetical protein
MKNYLILSIVFFVTSTVLAQTNFTIGFNNGYKKGYCQDQGIGCIEPIPPIAPNPKVGESSESYNDGYNRGFQTGLNATKSSDSNSGYQTAKAKYVENIISRSSNLKKIEVLKNLDRKLEFNRIYVQNIKSRIQKLKESISDDLINKGLDEINESVSNYEKPVYVDLAESSFIKIDNYLEKIEKYANEENSDDYYSDYNPTKIYYLKAETDLRVGPSEDYKKLVNEKASKHFGKTVNVSVSYYNNIKIISEKDGWSNIEIVEPESMSIFKGWIATKYILKR